MAVPTIPAQYLGPLAIGGRVHKALEHYYKKADDPLITHALLLDQARIDLEEDGFSLDKLDSEGELGRIMLEGYLDWVADEGLDADISILGVEEILKVDVLPGRDAADRQDRPAHPAAARRHPGGAGLQDQRQLR